MSSRTRWAGALLALGVLTAGDCDGNLNEGSIVVAVTDWISMAPGGAQGNGVSTNPAVSADGRFVVFQSTSTNLVAGDPGGIRTVYRRDLKAGVTEAVSVSALGAFGDGDSSNPAVSADGRYVAFESWATNLGVDGDPSLLDVFVKDMETGAVTLISVDDTGTPANDDSFTPSISGDGRFVAFASDADSLDLVTFDLNLVTDVFVHDRDADMNGTFDEPAGFSTIRVSVDSFGFEGFSGFLGSFDPAISGNGRFVAFVSDHDELDLDLDDINFVEDIYVHDLMTAETIHVSKEDASDPDGPGDFRNANGVSLSPSISADGTLIAFETTADDLVADPDLNGFTLDVIVRDWMGDVSSRVSVNTAGNQATEDCTDAAISGNGRFVAFTSSASNLVSGDTNLALDVFIRDTAAGGTFRLSTQTFGGQTQTIDASGEGALADDGRWAAFSSLSGNLVPGDTGGTWDVFVRGPLY